MLFLMKKSINQHGWRKMNIFKHTFRYRSLVLLAAAGIIMSALYCSSAGNTGRGNETDTVQEKVPAGNSGYDYTGVYRLKGDPICTFMLTIKKENGNYSYAFTGDTYKSTGRLAFTKTEDGLYLVFTNTICSGINSPVEGLFEENKIMIQNYGNGMNKYACFRDCDSKYLQFIKTE